MPTQRTISIEIKQMVILPGDERPFATISDSLTESGIRSLRQLYQELELHADELRLHYGYHLITTSRELYLAVAPDSEETVVGMMTVLKAPLEGRDTGPVGILYDGVVLPDYRRRRIGTKLLEAIALSTRSDSASDLFTPVETLCASLPSHFLAANHMLSKYGFEYASGGTGRYEYEYPLTQPHLTA